jgi:hypothetical protein
MASAPRRRNGPDGPVDVSLGVAYSAVPDEFFLATSRFDDVEQIR